MKSEKVRYEFKGVYKNENGVSKIEVYKNFNNILSEKEEKEELYNFNQMLVKWYKADTIITSSINKVGEANVVDYKEIKGIDLNELKSFDLENKDKIEQLITVMEKVGEFELQTGFEEETDLVDEDELKENRENIIKAGLDTIKEMYKFMVKLGFSNEEINKWIGELNEN
jgi:hypothetical protein